MNHISKKKGSDFDIYHFLNEKMKWMHACGKITKKT